MRPAAPSDCYLELCCLTTESDRPARPGDHIGLGWGQRGKMRCEEILVTINQGKSGTQTDGTLESNYERRGGEASTEFII